MRSTTSPLPRRVAVLYAAFTLMSVALFGAGVAWALHGVLPAAADGENLALLGSASNLVSLAHLSHGDAGLRRTVMSIQQERGLAYCGVVGSDGKFLAHSERRLRGDSAPDPPGERAIWGGIRRTRYRDAQGRSIREYRAPLLQGDQSIGQIVIGVTEPSPWRTAALTVAGSPWASLAAVCLLVVGALMILRQVNPVAAVDGELRRLARVPSLLDTAIERVPVHSGAALGWNRLVQERIDSSAGNGLEERLKVAIESRGERRGDEILNSLSDGVAVTDENGAIEFANRALTAILGLGGDSDAAKGKSVLELISRFAPIPPASPLQNEEMKQRPVVAEVEQGEGKTLRVLRVARTPIRNEQGASQGHVWSLRDVSQQRFAEQMRDQFLDSATHELRTPLANIKAYAETLALSEMMDIEQQKQFCNTINTEATRLARFIDDLLSVSSMEVGSLSISRTEVDVERLLTEVIGKITAQMDAKSISFNTAMPAKLPKLHIDKDKISASLVNLLGNAAKYTPEGGNVTLRVRSDDQVLMLAVEDNGFGIAEEELPRVFDKFFRSGSTAVQEETGTGLGLSFAQEVVRLHDGTIELESKLGEGSTFTVRLPIA